MDCSGSTTIRATKDQVSCNLGDEAVILNVRSGIYYGLNPVGTFVWNLLGNPKTFPEICDAILCEYDVESVRCERDLSALVDELAASGLIEIQDASAV